jgi:hypothetical protein
MLFDLFPSEGINILVNGIREPHFHELYRNICYENFSEKKAQISNFWEIVHNDLPEAKKISYFLKDLMKFVILKNFRDQ